MQNHFDSITVPQKYLRIIVKSWIYLFRKNLFFFINFSDPFAIQRSTAFSHFEFGIRHLTINRRILKFITDYRWFCLLSTNCSTTVVRVVRAPPFWECEENDIKRRTIIDSIQQCCLFIFYVRITFCVHTLIPLAAENVSATIKCISGDFHFELILCFLRHAYNFTTFRTGKSLQCHTENSTKTGRRLCRLLSLGRHRIRAVSVGGMDGNTA